MKNYLLLLIITSMVFNSQAQTTTKANNQTGTQNNKLVNHSYSYKIIESSDKTFGYEIYTNKKIMIRQNSIPGRQSNQGFATKKQAKTIAKIVTKKLQKGIMPPTITADELLQNGIK